MVKIQGPITFKKGQPIPDKVKQALKEVGGLREIQKQKVKEKPKTKPKKSKQKKSKKKKA